MGRLNFDYAPALGVPTASATDVSKQAASTEFVQNVVPPGVVFPYAGPIPPDGWLLADGSAVSRTLYPRLFAAIGTTYGVGDGTTTFNLPDLRGEFIRGLDNARGVDAGRALGSAQADAFQGHRQRLRSNVGTELSQYINLQQNTGIAMEIPVSSGGVSGATTTGAYVSDGTNGTPRVSSETRPRNVAMNFIIKSQ